MAGSLYIYADSLSSNVNYYGDCYVSTGNSGLINVKEVELAGSDSCDSCFYLSGYPLPEPTPTPSTSPDPTKSPTPTITSTCTPTPTLTLP